MNFCVCSHKRRIVNGYCETCSRLLEVACLASLEEGEAKDDDDSLRSKLKTLYDKWEFSRCSPDATEIANDIRIALCELPHEDLIYTCKCSFNPPKKLIKRETPPPPITENYHPEDGVPPPPIDPAEFEALNAEVRRLRDIEREYNLWSKVQKNREPRFEMSKVLQMCIEAEDRAEAAEIELEHLQTIVRKKNHDEPKT